MIRIILDEVDGKVVLDVMDARHGARLDVSQHETVADAVTAIVKKIGGWSIAPTPLLSNDNT